MTREERAEELNAMRQTHPARLIAAYREATNMSRLEQMPRGLGFTGMIEAILNHEFEIEAPHCQLPEVACVPAPQENCQPIATESLNLDSSQHSRALLAELRALCSGAAMVLTGLLMAAIYLLLKYAPA